jgi:outer membrane protein insertion porin family
VTREREIGFTSTAVLEIFPFRTLSVQHSYSRVAPIDQSDFDDTFTRSVLSATGAFGRADDYLSPTSGFLIRPAVEFASAAFGSDTEYLKGGVSLSGYVPLSRRSVLAARLYGGFVEPTGAQTEADIRDDARFSTVRFYGGGSNDARGWGTNAMGPKVALRDSAVVPQYRYRPIGGLSKFSGNLEFRLPVPKLGSAWQSALFLDFGKIGDDKIRLGSGLGIRYKTPIGYIRIDGAAKLNPSSEDLRSARDVIVAGSVDAADPRFGRRLRLHVSIGHLF